MLSWLPDPLYPFFSHDCGGNVFWKARQGKSDSLISDSHTQRCRDSVLLILVFKMSGTWRSVQRSPRQTGGRDSKPCVLYGVSVAKLSIYSPKSRLPAPSQSLLTAQGALYVVVWPSP